MYKNISNIIKQSTNILSDITKNVSTVEKKKSSSFYDDYLERSSQKKNETESAIKNPTFKLPDLTLQKWQSAIQSPESVGSTIKKNIKNVLSKKYGALDTKNLFDDIDDKDVEDNIETAENTIKTNIDIGALNKSLLTKLPNLRDGLALSYAAANKGNNKEATKAREAAYMEQESTKTFDNLLTNTSANQPTKQSSFYEDYLKKKEPSKNNNNFGNKLAKDINLPNANKNPRYVKADVLNMRSEPGVSSRVVGTLTDGTEVNYTGNKTKEIDGHLWAEVTYDGKTGWVAADYLKTAKPQDNSAHSSVTTQKPAQSISADSVSDGSKIDINDHSALQSAFNNVRKPGATDNDLGDPGDFDGVWGLQCVDLPNWFLENYTTLGRVSGNGKDIAGNIAKEYGLEVTTIPTAPAIFSVKEGTYGPGIRTGGVSHSTAGHTGIALAVKDLGDDLYEITYIDTYNALKSNEYNSNINTKTFKKGDNVTYVSLEGYLK